MVATFDYRKHHDVTVSAAKTAARNDAIECPYCTNGQLVTRGNWLKHMGVHHAERTEYLDYDEAREFSAHESVIQAGVSMFRAAGKALQEINAKRLYRTHYTTFADYCYERWQISRAYAYRLISASEVAENLTLSPIGDTGEVLINEAQARELAPLKPDEQRVVWEVVKQTAPKGKVTAQHIKSVVNVCKDLTVSGAIDNGTGEQIAVSEVGKAAITEETYERMKRQEIHIAESIARKEAKLATPPAPASEPTVSGPAVATSEAELQPIGPIAPPFSIEQRDGVYVAVMVIGEFGSHAAAMKAIARIQSQLAKDC